MSFLDRVEELRSAIVATLIWMSPLFVAAVALVIVFAVGCECDWVAAPIVTAKAQFGSILRTDHNVRETLSIVDRAYILHEGQVLMDGKPDDIVNDPNVRRVYLGERFSL